ncbi:MAG: sigma-54-dependent Fis family transcriptional regulator [Planctomycetes bacterium]|nr:sigma-54-dependent Fis family transcriptional regulator [Planctomycetota bacterium]
MASLLVIDDEPSILHAFRRVFDQPEITVCTASTGREGIELFQRHRPDAVILDVRLPDMSGMDVFQTCRAIDPKVPVILITGHGSAEMAITAMQQGAFDYLFKPLELDEVRQLVDRALKVRRAMSVPALTAEETVDGEDGADLLIGRCPAMLQVYRDIGRVAAQDVTVLIRGESGTGKELVARAIYHHSHRADGPFLAVNCAAIPEGLLESELFGHERGAFTGADHRRIGKVEQCRGGTLFLDEIGDMPPLLQAKLLRFLQEQEFQRVGGNETLKADVRVLAATNRNLEQMVEDGLFRKDLYYRLSVYTITLPPLRERADDINLLVEHMVKRFSRELKTKATLVPADTMNLLRAYSWPGNVRELESVLKQALLTSSGHVLLPEFLPEQLRGQWAAQETFPDLKAFLMDRIRRGCTDLYALTIAAVDRQIISTVLEHTRGNKLQSARLLGITRTTLRKKMRALGLEAGGTTAEQDLDWPDSDHPVDSP